jgi:putative endonuclease
MEAAGKLERLWIDAQEWGLGWMDRLRRQAGRAAATAPHLATGLLGERAALFELSRRGYIVVARRWTSARVRGDVDLIGWDGERLCFVEVKTRSVRDMTPAESAVDEGKRRMLRGLARAYLRTFPESERRSIPVRFDVVSVYLIDGSAEFEVFQGAFGWH